MNSMNSVIIQWLCHGPANVIGGHDVEKLRETSSSNFSLVLSFKK